MFMSEATVATISTLPTNMKIKLTFQVFIYAWTISIKLVAAQAQINCNIQFTSAGAYIFQTGSISSMSVSSGNLSSTPLSLANNCGSISYSSTTQLYRWSPSSSLSVQYLLVAGGGAGGENWGGGGGGGGVLSGSYSVTPKTNYDFLVGNGSTGSVETLDTGNSGGNSTGFGLTAYGGGGGGGGEADSGNNGSDGGSGGGAGIYLTKDGTVSTTGGKGTVGQGYAGGNQLRGANPWSTAGGGGGAASAGITGIGNTGGNGGKGFSSSITGSNVVYSAGGGGAGYSLYSITAGKGGSDGSGGDGDDGVADQYQAGGRGTTPGSGGGGGSGHEGTNGPGLTGLVVIAFSITAPFAANSNNTLLGNQAGLGNTSAFNTFIGAQAGQFDINGHGNMYLGSGSGPVNNNINPDYNTLISIGSHSVVPGSLTQNAISIGSGTTALSNQMRLGDNSLNTFRVGGVPLWTTTSDRNLKSNIQAAHRGLAFINSIRAVQYELKSNGSTHLGFIAQEIEKADKLFYGILKPQKEGEFYALNYESFIPSLVQATQEIDQEISTLKIPDQKVLEKRSVLVFLILSNLFLILICSVIFFRIQFNMFFKRTN